MTEENDQGRGIARRLLQHLVRIAREKRRVAPEPNVLAGNQPMLTVFRRSGLSIQQRSQGGVVYVTLLLPAENQEAPRVNRGSPVGLRSVARLPKVLRGARPLAFQRHLFRSGLGSGKPLPFDAARAHALYKGLFGEVEDPIKGSIYRRAVRGPDRIAFPGPRHPIIRQDPNDQWRRSGDRLVCTHPPTNRSARRLIAQGPSPQCAIKSGHKAIPRNWKCAPDGPDQRMRGSARQPST